MCEEGKEIHISNVIDNSIFDRKKLYSYHYLISD